MQHAEVLRLVQRMLGAWPYPPRGVYAQTLAAALTEYPADLVARFCDPINGYAATNHYPPNIAQAREWMALRMPRKPEPPRCSLGAPEKPVDRSARPTLDDLRRQYPDLFPMRQLAAGKSTEKD